MRDGWDDTDNCMIVDCGAVGSLAGGHGHADALSIELAMHGPQQRWHYEVRPAFAEA